MEKWIKKYRLGCIRCLTSCYLDFPCGYLKEWWIKQYKFGFICIQINICNLEIPFWKIRKVWQTDIQTDRQTYRQTGPTYWVSLPETKKFDKLEYFLLKNAEGRIIRSEKGLYENLINSNPYNYSLITAVHMAAVS